MHSIHPQPIQLGIVGLGRAGSIHLEAVQSVAGAHVAAVCDANPAARQLAERVGVAAFATLEGMLDRVALDAVVICTPPIDHAAIATECLEYGLHVLCEKPLALSTWDVLTMLQTANRAQRAALVASKFRHVPEVARARKLLNAGELGEPVSFEISFCSPVDMRARWNSESVSSGGGVVIDHGCHAFDIVSFLFGSIRRVYATRLKPLQALAVEDSATLQVWAGDGVVGRVDLSWSLALPRDSYLVVHGSRGTIAIGWQGARMKHAGEDWRPIGGAYDKVGAHRAMHERFVAAVAGTGAPWITTAECLQAVAAVDAAYRSLESGTSEWLASHGPRELDRISPAAARVEQIPTAAPRLAAVSR